MTFLDLDCNHSVGSFVEALEERGFTRTASNKKADAVLRGSLEGYDCLLHIYGTFKTKMVYLLRIEFAHTESWEELVVLYERFSRGITSLLNEENREEYIVTHRNFRGGYEEGDGRELEGVANGNITISTNFVDLLHFGMGNIQLRVNASERGEGWLTIDILDMTNSSLHQSETQNAL